MPYLNKEDKRANDRAYYLRNREAIIKRNKTFRAAHPERRKAEYKNNRETYRRRLQEWREANPERARMLEREATRRHIAAITPKYLSKVCPGLPPELHEVKRLQILIKRKLKETTP